jgi:hypothetical protein
VARFWRSFANRASAPCRGDFNRPSVVITSAAYSHADHIAPVAHLFVAQAVDGFVFPQGGGGGAASGVCVVGVGGDGVEVEALVVAAVGPDFDGVCGALGPLDGGVAGGDGDVDDGFPGGRVDDQGGADDAEILADGVGVVAGGFDARNEAAEARHDAEGHGLCRGGQVGGLRVGTGAGAAVALQVFECGPQAGVALHDVVGAEGVAEGGGIGLHAGHVDGADLEQFGVDGQAGCQQFEQFCLAAVVLGHVVVFGHPFFSFVVLSG